MFNRFKKNVGLCFLFLIFLQGVSYGNPEFRAIEWLSFPVVNNGYYLQSDSGGATYFYNDANQLSKIESDSGSVTLVYDDEGFLIKEKYSNGNQWTIEYNADKTQSTDSFVKGGTISQVNHSTYDNHHNLVQVIRAYDDITVPNLKILYTFDNLNIRIKRQRYYYDSSDDSFKFQASSTYSYEKDNNGNITKETCVIDNIAEDYSYSFTWDTQPNIDSNSSSNSSGNDDGSSGCFIHALY
jgi:YD repeat-containing protein